MTEPSDYPFVDLGLERTEARQRRVMSAAPGRTSQRNAERQGFRIAYTRIKWHLRRPGG